MRRPDPALAAQLAKLTPASQEYVLRYLGFTTDEIAAAAPEEGSGVMSGQNAWNVYVGGERVATVDLTDAQTGPFRNQLADRTAYLRLAAWEDGTLTTGGTRLADAGR